jgi:hypothetical protein
MGVIRTRALHIQARGDLGPDMIGTWPGMGTGMGMGAEPEMAKSLRPICDHQSSAVRLDDEFLIINVNTVTML